jgi:uncharacterized protein (TIGR02466 family)
MNEFNYFCSPIYKIEKPEFVDIARQVAEEYIDRNKETDEIHPLLMSANIFADARLLDFGSFIAQATWDVLNHQGYAMDGFTTHVTEMWMQEHGKNSSMEQHIHKNVHMVGFYFIDTPENCPRAIFHDPRPGKVMSDLPERDMVLATAASGMINFECKAGDLILANAWLPHSFSRNRSEHPFRFLHFSMYAQPLAYTPPPAEVI